MRPDRVVVTTPLFDDHLRRLQRVEDFPVEQLIPEPGIEALDKTVLPG